MRKKKAAAAPAPVPAAAKTKSAAAVPAAAKKKPLAAKKKAAAAVPAAKKKAAAAAKKRASGGTAGCRPRKRARDDNGDGDLISNLPDAVLCTIISLLPTKDGARTQAIARRWRPLWRSAPLNLDAKNLSTNDFKQPRRRQGRRPSTESIISRILADHPGPARRFDIRLPCISPTKREYAKSVAQIASWFQSRSLDNLEELHIHFPILRLVGPNPLLSSVLRFTSTLVVATVGYCDVSDEIAPSLNFPILKHLTLRYVNISVGSFHGVLSACHVLETLSLDGNSYNGSLHISSRTLRSICFSNCHMGKSELVIEDTPHLERLLCPWLDGEAIRVSRAPKLDILGPLSPCISNIQIANLVFQGLVPTSFNNLICTVKVLALEFSCADLNAVLDVLRFFPCLEKLYVMWNKYLNTEMNNVRHYDPQDPIKCLETHLKTLVLKNYKGDKQDVSFAKFFVLNGKVLNEIKFGVSEKFNEKWVADQHRLLGVESEASPDLEFKHCSYYFRHSDTHDLSIADPFNNSFLAEDDALPVISCSSSSDEDST
ncbi:F-box/LRR-repeat protein At3g59190-like [Triticum dicoccoides]|uniref:F-box/LRR-repeat protein At3g59190-like n=1 Tax=Triticum dicoccoides TaxID=85692 RepID=UPI000842DA5B|nr:F-box/LRR-repeat protein At3g59190-like [Triticum dicoccoides]XP_044459489.1 F-box/LRR-repeat protein At3g59190-like [Triticum aestivum]